MSKKSACSLPLPGTSRGIAQDDKNSTLQHHPESHIKVSKIKKIGHQLKKHLILNKSPPQHLRKCIENSMENMHTEVKV